MKFDIESFRILFNSYIKNSPSTTRKHCPQLDAILSSMSQSSSERTKLRISDHLGHCYQCMNDFMFILSIQKEQERLLNGWTIPLGQSYIDLSKKGKSSFQKSISFVALYKRTAILLLGILTIYCFFSLLLRNKFVEAERADIGYFHIVQPLDSIQRSSKLFFEWEGITESCYFVVELFDEILNLVWRSPQVSETSIELPCQILGCLKSNKSYFWFVSSILQDGRKIESELIEFRILENH